jgi:hypothetical protein
MEGASPESTQVTVNAVPPGILAPGAGTVNLTSARASWAAAASQGRTRHRRILACDLAVKRGGECADVELDDSE